MVTHLFVNVSYDPAIPPLGAIPRRLESRDSGRYQVLGAPDTAPGTDG